MKRWAVWFGIGLADFFIWTMGHTPSHATTFDGMMSFAAQHPEPPMQDFLLFIAAVWLAITIVAVPIVVIYWLIKGRAS